jgi:hypothetical protein
MHQDWNNPDSVIALVNCHLQAHPLLQVQDVYKLLYQGVLGSEHLMNFQGAEKAALMFEKRLRAEFESVEADKNEPLFESIHPSGKLQRLNLRIYKARRGDLSLLAVECLQVAQCSWGTLAELAGVWDIFVNACKRDKLPGMGLTEVMHFTSWLESDGFPSVHHSQIYRDAYRPAYRLVSGNWLAHK